MYEWRKELAYGWRARWIIKEKLCCIYKLFRSFIAIIKYYEQKQILYIVYIVMKETTKINEYILYTLWLSFLVNWLKKVPIRSSRQWGSLNWVFFFFSYKMTNRPAVADSATSYLALGSVIVISPIRSGILVGKHKMQKAKGEISSTRRELIN